MNRFDNPLEKRKLRKGTKTYWKFQAIVNELLQEQKECSICGSSKNLEAHHVIKCESNEVLYINPDNLIVLCHKCHSEYHNKFEEVNPQTLIKFVKTPKNKKRRKNRKRFVKVDKLEYPSLKWRQKHEDS